MINGISHITFIVRDIEKASQFFRTVFDAEEVYSSGEEFLSLSKEKYFLISDLWFAVMEGEPPKEETYNHIAFLVDEEEFNSLLEKINSLGLKILKGRDRVEGEGRSIYFYDYDNHLFEFHAGSLMERLDSYNRLKENKNEVID